MTVSSTDYRAQFNANGSQTNFPYSFLVLEENDLVVIATNTTSSTLDGIAANSDSTLTLTTDYTVNGVGTESGSIDTVATWSTGIRITVVRQTDRTQETDYLENDPFPAETHEDALDKLTLITQEAAGDVERALIFPDSDPDSAIGELPTATDRASKALLFGADGKPVAGTIEDLDTVVSSFMATVLDDVDATEVLATLGLTVTSFANSLLDDADAAAARVTLGLDNNSDVGDIAGLTHTDGVGIVGDGSNWVSETFHGQHTIFVPAAAMTPRSSTGATPTIIEPDTPNLNPALNVMSFAAAADDFVQFPVMMPESWNAGTLVVQPVWTANSASTNSVVWIVYGLAFADDDNLDVETGLGLVSVTDAHKGVAYDLNITAESSGLTVGGSPAGGQIVQFHVRRQTGNPSDNLAADAHLIGLKIHYTTDAMTDS